MKTLALRRNLTVGLMILLVGTFGLPGMAQAATIYVDDDNTTGFWDGTLEHPYQFIQDGVDSASHGDTVYVFNGTYAGDVRVEGISISLIGQNRDSTVIDGGAYGIRTFGDSVTISGFTIQNTGYEGVFQNGGRGHVVSGNRMIDCGGMAGIVQMYGCSEAIVSGNVITGCNVGIHQRYNYDGIISGNEITDNELYGINCAVESWGFTISGNTIANSGQVGIYLNQHQENFIITDNSTERGIYIEGDSLLSYWNTHTIENNYANGKPIYYYKDDSSGITVPSDAGQVILANCANFTIEGLNISGVSTGILLGFSSDNSITGNTITGTPWYGIDLAYSSNNDITGNTITDGWPGKGIYLNNGSCNNTITENTISDYVFCIFDLPITNRPPSIDNIIYHNNFINNGAHAEDSNFWDDGYPSGGNYWSDFDEPSEGAYDNNGDGIVDSPYGVGGGNQDRYPLMHSWDGAPPTPNCADANGDGAVDVGDITYLINYLFLGTSGPWPAQCVGDANCDASADIGDVIFLIGYTFSGSSQPGDCCCSGWEK